MKAGLQSFVGRVDLAKNKGVRAALNFKRLKEKKKKHRGHKGFHSQAFNAKTQALEKGVLNSKRFTLNKSRTVFPK